MKRSEMKVASDALLGFDSGDGVCPFCGEGDFDLVGLKMHLLRGWCDKFNDTSLDVPRTREANDAVRREMPAAEGDAKHE